MRALNREASFIQRGCKIKMEACPSNSKTEVSFHDLLGHLMGKGRVLIGILFLPLAVCDELAGVARLLSRQQPRVLGRVL